MHFDFLGNQNQYKGQANDPYPAVGKKAAVAKPVSDVRLEKREEDVDIILMDIAKFIVKNVSCYCVCERIKLFF